MKVEKRKNGFGNISESELKHIQDNLLDLLLEFDAICKKHGIVYYLDGGSVIGAMRHEGFVPWDDDVDLLIKRSEFEKLMKVIDDEIDSRPSRVFSYMGRRTNHHRPFARYVNTKIPHITRNAITEATYPPGIFIDIFILDPVPASSLRSHIRNLERSEEWFHKYLNGVVQSMPIWEYKLINRIERYVGTDAVFRYFDRKLSAYDDADADYYVPRNGFNYAVYDADVFAEPQYLRFEGHDLPGPTMPEKFLRTHYSIDWFNLPPEETRYSNHVTLMSERFTVKQFEDEFRLLNKRPKVREVQERRHLIQLRRKPHLVDKDRQLANIIACRDGLELNAEMKSWREADVPRLISDKQFDKLNEIFGAFYKKQLSPELRPAGVKLDVSLKYVRDALLALLESGRFYDAERILVLYEKSHSGLTEIRAMVDQARAEEITEQDDPEMSKPILRNVPAVPENECVDEYMEALRNKRFELLEEIDTLCGKHGIDYTLAGNVLVDAVRGAGESLDEYTSVNIAMTPENYKKFMALKSCLPQDRVIENLFNNPCYPDETMRYVDVSTTSFQASSPWYLHPGVEVTIQLLFTVQDTWKRRLIKRMSGVVRGRSAYPRRARTLLAMPVTRLHRRHLQKILDIPRDYVRFQVLTKPRKAAISFNEIDMQKYSRASLRGKSWQIIDCLPGKLYASAPWLDGVALKNEYPEEERVSSLRVACADFMGRAPRGSIARFNRSLRRSRRLREQMKVVEREKYSHNKFLMKVAYSFYRFDLFLKYSNRRSDLLNAFGSQNFGRLRLLLSDYIYHFNYFFQQKKILVFDDLVFSLYVELLRHEGKNEFADYVSSNLKVGDYKFKTLGVAADMTTAGRRLRSQYAPIKPELARLLASDSLDHIQVLLRDYDDLFVQYLAHDQVFVFDAFVFSVYLETLRRNGHMERAKLILKLFKSKNYMKYDLSSIGG